MARSVTESTEAALRRFDVKFFKDDETFLVPIPLHDFGLTLIHIHPHENPPHILIGATVCSVVPAARRADVALHLANLNAQWNYATFWMRDQEVGVDDCTDLETIPDPEPLIARSFVGLIQVLNEEHAGILRLVRKRSRSISKVEREVAALVDHLDAF